MYGLLKLQKSTIPDLIPIQPVVSYIKSPTYDVQNFLNSYIKENINLQFQFVIKNSIDLISNLKEINLPFNATFFSLDVKNLYTRIPVNERLSILNEFFYNSNLSNDTADDLLKLLRICLEQNFFKYINVTYAQESLPMGSPLSPVLADIRICRQL